MGEYVKYRGEEVKIGTVENMYYTSFQKYINALEAGLLETAPGSDKAGDYALPNSGCRFRFPFPDEDKLPLGDIIEPFDRGLIINLKPSEVPFLEIPDQVDGFLEELLIIQQKLINRQSDGKLCLALVFRDPVRAETFRLEDDEDVKAITDQIIKHHIDKETEPARKEYFRQVCSRILDGYGLDNPALKVKQEEKVVKPKSIKPSRKKFKHGL